MLLQFSAIHYFTVFPLWTMEDDWPFQDYSLAREAALFPKNIRQLRKAQEKAIAMLARNPLLGQAWRHQPE
jgi:hypothetical protein